MSCDQKGSADNLKIVNVGGFLNTQENSRTALKGLRLRRRPSGKKRPFPRWTNHQRAAALTSHSHSHARAKQRTLRQLHRGHGAFLPLHFHLIKNRKDLCWGLQSGLEVRVEIKPEGPQQAEHVRTRDATGKSICAHERVKTKGYFNETWSPFKLVLTTAPAR